jgi:hypothetical protein
MSVCSVENPNPPEDHNIVSEHSQEDLSPLTSVFSGSKCGAKVPFDHADRRFRLPALPIFLFVKTPSHETAVVSCWQLVCGAAYGGGYDRANTQKAPSENVIEFAPVSSICHQGINGNAHQGLNQCLAKMNAVGTWAPARDRRHDQMAGAIAQDAYFRMSRVSFLPVFPGFFAPAKVVSANVTRFKAGPIERCQLQTLSRKFALARLLKRGGKQRTHELDAQ